MAFLRQMHAYPSICNAVVISIGMRTPCGPFDILPSCEVENLMEHLCHCLSLLPWDDSHFLNHIFLS